MIRSVIFDLDGVLCYTDLLHYKAWKAICDEYAFKFTEEDNLRLRGVSRSDCVDIILNLQEKVPADFDALVFATKKNALYVSLLQDIGHELLDVETVLVLSQLKERGIGIALGSSSKNALLIVEKLGIMSYFDAIVDGSVLTRSKPSPEVFIRAAERLGVVCRDCLVVEDARAGIEAAIAGGFRTAGIGAVARLGMVDYCLHRLSDVLNIEELPL
jgi:beta-phosphoglucomutase